MRRTLQKLILAFFGLAAIALSAAAEETNNPGKTILPKPDGPQSYIERGIACCNKEEWDKAINDFREAVRLDPTNAAGYQYLGVAYLGNNELDKAITNFSGAIQLDPTSAKAYLNRANTYDAKGEYHKAASDLSESLRLNPKDADALMMRGFYSCEKSQFDKAVPDYAEAIHLDPGNDRAYTQLGWLRATCPVASVRDSKEAVELATRGCELAKWRHWYGVDALAAAYAEAGDFEKAIQYQKQALDMKGIPDKYRKDLEGRLSLYERHQPFHEWHKRQGQ
jgi:tetratricopeptide (TPR) repeat protein